MPGIAFIIPTRDRPHELACSLGAIGSLCGADRFGGAEVIIVDNASATPVVAPTILRNGARVRVIRLERNAGAAARNIVRLCAVRELLLELGEKLGLLLAHRFAQRVRLVHREPGEIVRDSNGLAMGGARLPAVDAPIAELTGITDAPSVFCSLFGAGEPFTEDQLAALYDSHEDYVAQVSASASAAVEAGWLLPDDRDMMVTQAEVADIP